MAGELKSSATHSTTSKHGGMGPAIRLDDDDTQRFLRRRTTMSMRAIS